MRNFQPHNILLTETSTNICRFRRASDPQRRDAASCLLRARIFHHPQPRRGLKRRRIQGVGPFQLGAFASALALCHVAIRHDSRYMTSRSLQLVSAVLPSITPLLFGFKAAFHTAGCVPVDYCGLRHARVTSCSIGSACMKAVT